MLLHDAEKYHAHPYFSERSLRDTKQDKARKDKWDAHVNANYRTGYEQRYAQRGGNIKDLPWNTTKKGK